MTEHRRRQAVRTRIELGERPCGVVVSEGAEGSKGFDDA